MKDDFTRITFDPTKHFSRVLMQQGRVTLDADQNEQADILLYYLRTLARDILGPYAAPSSEGGFRLISTAAHPLVITAGRYYVDGILVENEEDCAYDEQPDYPLLAGDPLLKEMQNPTGQTFWVYLDVWERNITWIEDDSIREKALNGPDTCARSKVVWQVKALSQSDLTAKPVNKGALQKTLAALQKELEATSDPAKQDAIQAKIDAIRAELAAADRAARIPMTCDGPLVLLTGASSASMTAQLDPGQQIPDPCITSPSARYRGAENQLYRVEIHRGGVAGTATFKWSRDNGSVATPWVGTSGNDLQVGNTRGFEAGVWIDLTDDIRDLHGEPGPLVKLAKVDGGVLTVDQSSIGSASIAWSDQFLNPKIRRWDQHGSDAVQLVEGAVPITESGPDAPVWIDLEDGIQVTFALHGSYRSGDYWTIPARVATGQIEWPSSPDANGNYVHDAVAPDGIQHYYAPLGTIQWNDGELRFQSCRCEFSPINSCYGKGSVAVGAHLLANPPNTRTVLPAARQRTRKRTRNT